MAGRQKNPFYDSNEVDDDDFLRKPRSNYMLPQHSVPAPSMQSSSATNTLSSDEDRRQMLMRARREIEERTLQSSSNSLGLLYESEKVGVATAEELAKQKEQLKATEQRLDDISATLRQSERHLTGIKSVFGGLRNYFSGRAPSSVPAGGGAPVAASGMGRSSALSPSQSDSAMGASRYSPAGADAGRGLDDLRNASHPGLRMRGLEEEPGSVDDILDRNLEEMSMGLSRLKGLANNLNTELDEHNAILDRLDHKTGSTHLRIEKQNKDMSKLLKK